MKRESEPPILTLHQGDAASMTGEQVLREGSQMLADWFTQRLDDLHADDPFRPRVQVAAEQLRLLAG